MDDHVRVAVEWSVKDQKVEIITLSPEEKAKWDEKLKFMTDKWVADAKEKGFPAEAVVQDIKDLIKKHSQ